MKEKRHDFGWLVRWLFRLVVVLVFGYLLISVSIVLLMGSQTGPDDARASEDIDWDYWKTDTFSTLVFQDRTSVEVYKATIIALEKSGLTVCYKKPWGTTTNADCFIRTPGTDFEDGRIAGGA